MKFLVFLMQNIIADIFLQNSVESLFTVEILWDLRFPGSLVSKRQFCRRRRVKLVSDTMVSDNPASSFILKTDEKIPIKQ